MIFVLSVLGGYLPMIAISWAEKKSARLLSSAFQRSIPLFMSSLIFAWSASLGFVVDCADRSCLSISSHGMDAAWTALIAPSATTMRPAARISLVMLRSLQWVFGCGEDRPPFPDNIP